LAGFFDFFGLCTGFGGGVLSIRRSTSSARSRVSSSSDFFLGAVMYIFYIDDSDEGSMHTFCALGIPSDAWRETFNLIKNWRQQLKESDGYTAFPLLEAICFKGANPKNALGIIG
jgi:hypothetical protein